MGGGGRREQEEKWEGELRLVCKMKKFSYKKIKIKKSNTKNEAG